MQAYSYHVYTHIKLKLLGTWVVTEINGHGDKRSSEIIT